jgi:glucose-6-phosphate isomerase
MEQKSMKTNKPTSVQIKIREGQMLPNTTHDQRFVSHLTEQFSDQIATMDAIKNGDPLVYELFHHVFLTDRTDMAFGMSVIAAGKVGNEYYMTKGHLHESDDQSEVYYCVSGMGLLLMDDLKNDFQAMPFSEGTVIHIPPQYAHRVVNTGNEKLTFVSVFHVAAGHVYQSVAEAGFAYLVMDVVGKPTLIPNPKRANYLNSKTGN